MPVKNLLFKWKTELIFIYFYNYQKKAKNLKNIPFIKYN